MKLIELEPEFLQYNADVPNTFHHTDDIANAAGIIFLCPKCFKEKGRIGTHFIICWDPSVPQSVSPQPGRWKLLGNSYEDLTLFASPQTSVQLLSGCKAHFTVKNGEIIDN